MKRMIMAAVLLVSSVSFADITRGCSDEEMQQFDRFLKKNKIKMERKAEDRDLGVAFVYSELLELIDHMASDENLKKEKCGMAASFCKEDSSGGWRVPLLTIDDPDFEATFGINRDECKKFFRVKS